jgi:hypothetical protein
MLIAAVFTTAKLWNQPKCPSNNEEIKKMLYKYIMEFCSAIKNNETLSFLGKWMDLEIFMLSEISQDTQRQV